MKSALVFTVLLSSAAHGQALVPQAIKERVNTLVAQCVQAGGQLGQMTGQGQFVIPRDFTGDGKTDFVISEGNVPCTGKPNLFRQNGNALVELYVGDGAGGAQLAFADRLLAFRAVDGKPARLQIARRGPGCGAGSPAAAMCGHELRWNVGATRFDEVPTGSSGGAPAQAVRPATILGGAPASAVAPVAAAATFPVRAGADAAFKARCRKEILAAEPRAVKWVDSECADRWKTIVAAGPAADALLAAATGPRDLAGLRARMAGVRWGATARGMLASGKAGNMDTHIAGKGQPGEVSAGWQGTGEMIPYDIAGAMEARGATVVQLSCEKMGAGEGNRAFSITPPGGKPFALKTDFRSAPTAGAMSYYDATVDLSGRIPARGGNNCEGL